MLCYKLSIIPVHTKKMCSVYVQMQFAQVAGTTEEIRCFNPPGEISTTIRETKNRALFWNIAKKSTKNWQHTSTTCDQKNRDQLDQSKNSDGKKSYMVHHVAAPLQQETKNSRLHQFLLPGRLQQQANQTSSKKKKRKKKAPKEHLQQWGNLKW